MEEKEALLVVDVDIWDNWKHKIEELSKEREIIALNIAKTLEIWRQAGKKIIFIVLVSSQVEEENRNRLIQLTEESHFQCLVCNLLPFDFRLAGFLGHRHGENYEPVFLKKKNNAFTNSDLINFLRSKGISKVFLAGCNTFACVQDTAVGAVEHGISVTLLKDCTYPALVEEQDKTWLDNISLRKSTTENEITVSIE